MDFYDGFDGSCFRRPKLLIFLFQGLSSSR